MTSYRRGDVVLVGFTFLDESGKRLRPDAVISTSAYHRGRQEVVGAAITSNVKRRLHGDHLLADWGGAGLLFPSLVTGIIRTIKHTLIERKLGSLRKPDLDAFDRELRRILGL
jgi:mRNA-degrading endonuclease toxin of MazEF toxin-antitoxin module